jgi:hypothetical protein
MTTERCDPVSPIVLRLIEDALTSMPIEVLEELLNRMEHGSETSAQLPIRLSRATRRKVVLRQRPRRDRWEVKRTVRRTG